MVNQVNREEDNKLIKTQTQGWKGKKKRKKGRRNKIARQLQLTG